MEVRAGLWLILTDQAGARPWPITAATFILMHKVPADAAASADALKFFDWAYKNGDKMAEELDYIPMPDNVVALVEAEWAKIKDPAGKPALCDELGDLDRGRSASAARS